MNKLLRQNNSKNRSYKAIKILKLKIVKELYSTYQPSKLMIYYLLKS